MAWIIMFFMTHIPIDETVINVWRLVLIIRMSVGLHSDTVNFFSGHQMQASYSEVLHSLL
jgi:hypothetical protein